MKTLVAVLSSFILAGQTKDVTVQQRVNSLHAASVYLLLLGIPGKQIQAMFERTCTMFIFNCTHFGDLPQLLEVCLLPLGSIASRIFHEVLLDTCTKLSLCCWPQDSGKKRKKDGQRHFQIEGKRFKPQRKDAAEANLRLLTHTLHSVNIGDLCRDREDA